MSGIEVSIDETGKEVAFSADGETTEVLSVTRDSTELNEGICNGVLKTDDTVDEGKGKYT